MFIKPTKAAKGNIFDIHDDAVDLLIYPLDEDVPCPWDPDVTIENGKVIVSGGMSPGGGDPYNTCICTLKVEDFAKYYKVDCPDNNESLINALGNAGWVEI